MGTEEGCIDGSYVGCAIGALFGCREGCVDGCEEYEFCNKANVNISYDVLR